MAATDTDEAATGVVAEEMTAVIAEDPAVEVPVDGAAVEQAASAMEMLITSAIVMTGRRVELTIPIIAMGLLRTED